MRYLVITESGGLVTLSAQQPDADAVASAAKRLIGMGVSGFVASASGPPSSDPELTMVRAFGDPAQTFQEARQRLANRRRPRGNAVFRVSNL